MDLVDAFFLALTRGPILAAGLYLLTMLLRIACHFVGIEIPAFGRAFFATLVIVGLSLVVGWYVQSDLVGSGGPPNIGFQFLAFIVSLGFHFILAALVYRLALRTSMPKALSVWLFQAVLFLVLGLVGGCCVFGYSSTFAVAAA